MPYAPNIVPSNQINSGPGTVSGYKEVPLPTDLEHQRSAWELNNPGKPFPGDVGTGDNRYGGGSELDAYIAGRPREVTPEQEQSIRDAARARMQAAIDAIGTEYNAIFAQEAQNAQGRLGQTRGINARAGLLGSDFGAANTAGTVEQNKANVEAIAAEKAAKIQNILLAADGLAQQEINSKRAEAQGNSALYIQNLKDQQEKVPSLLSAYAQTGGSLAKLQASEPAIYNMFLKGFGNSPLLLEGAYNASLPKPAQKDYHYEVKNGQVTAYAVGPDGNLIIKTEKIPGLEGSYSGEYDIKTSSSGQLYFIPKEIDPTKPLDQQIIKYGSGGQFNSNTENQTEKNAQARATMNAELVKVQDANGYVSPADYKKALDAWTARGFIAKDFNEAFSNFRDLSQDYPGVF